MARRLTPRKKMEIKRSAQHRKDRWETKLMRVLDNRPDGLTLAQLRQTRSIHNCPLSDRWLDQRLEYLQSLSLVWYNPDTRVWKAIPIEQLNKTIREHE